MIVAPYSESSIFSDRLRRVSEVHCTRGFTSLNPQTVTRTYGIYCKRAVYHVCVVPDMFTAVVRFGEVYRTAIRTYSLLKPHPPHRRNVPAKLRTACVVCVIFLC